jgi:arsenate reductase
LLALLQDASKVSQLIILFPHVPDTSLPEGPADDILERKPFKNLTTSSGKMMIPGSSETPGTACQKRKVLFLCTGNSCRSQMAEGWARHLKGDKIEPYSAGIEVHGLNPRAVQVMAEAGVDISGHRSKHLEELKDKVFHLVVTVCDHAAQTCPVFPGRGEKIHRTFDDPPALARQALTEEEALGHYRRVRDEIRRFVETLPAGV